MNEGNHILIGRGQDGVFQTLDLGLANRHGLVAGATGTGKTVTLQILAEAFSATGVPVFVADVKGDLAGLSQAGPLSEKMVARAELCGDEDYDFEPTPVVFWDLYGELGHPVRTTIAEMGPLLLSRLLGLNETQEGVMNVVFQLADDDGLLLLDLDDLRSLLTFVGENAKSLSLSYGRVSTSSVGAIQRRLLTLKQQGGEALFGEPALGLSDLMRTTHGGRGYVNVLAAERLMLAPKLYATFLLWLLSELFEELPEVGDPDKPKLIFFFDEAHLLFDDAPKVLLEKVEQVVRLIRSKGVGVYFVTQNPLDVPLDVLGQLGNRVQHALRAFTPRDKKAVKTAADTFRQNPAFDAAQAITELEVGEALVSTLQEKGVPSMVARTKIRPPRSRMGPITPAERQAVVDQSPVQGLYEELLNRESAHELLAKRANDQARQAMAQELAAAEERRRTAQDKALQSQVRARNRGRSSRMGYGEAITKSVVRSLGSQVGRTIGRELVRGVLGSFLRR
ncbi:MAG: helicase HerA-like domain-containing protein [Geminicoccaceae bacterium]